MSNVINISGDRSLVLQLALFPVGMFNRIKFTNESKLRSLSHKTDKLLYKTVFLFTIPIHH
jgi:hypothetical protein